MEAMMVMMVLVVVLGRPVLARTPPDPCSGHQWFRRDDSNGRWCPAVPDPRERTVDRAGPVLTYVPWGTVREQTANFDDTKNILSLGEGQSLPVLRCVVRRWPGRCLHHGSHAVVKGLCVAVDGVCNALVITHEEAFHCLCASTPREKGDDDMTMMPHVINMTLLGECPHTHDHAEGSRANVFTRKNIKFTQIPNDTNIYDRTLNTSYLSLGHPQTPDDSGTQNNPRNAMRSWELTIDIIICVVVISFVVFVVVSVMKRVRKEGDLNPQEEDVELASEETLLDYHEGTSSTLGYKDN